jgi:substrate-binding family protein
VRREALGAILSRPCAAALVLWLATMGTLACSLIYDPAPASQCATDDDCDRVPALRGRQCDISSGVCVDRFRQGLEPNVTCQSTRICTQQNANFASVCRGPGPACVPLETPDCYVSGDWEAANALFIGSISPQTQGLEGDRLSRPFVARALAAIDLGLEEWRFALPDGLPLSGRPLAIVHCDSGNDATHAQRVMDHLVDTVHADVVIALDDSDLQSIADRARDSGTTLVCATCYTASADDSKPGAAIWRMQPPLAEQAPMMAWRLADLERRLRESQGLPANAPLRIALLSQAYPGINQLVERVRALLAESDPLRMAADNFLELQSPDPKNESFSQPALARAIADFAPSIVLIAVDADFTTYYLRMIEEAWLTGTPRPSYVVTSMNAEVGLLEPIIGNDDELRRRLSGTAFFADADVLRNRSSFAARFRRRHLEEPDNVEAAYDAFYAVAFSLALRDNQGTLAALGLAPRFDDLNRGARIDIAPDAIQSAVAYLTEEGAIDLVGTSTPLDWDLTSHDVRSDIGMWCLERTPSGALAINPDAGPRLGRADGVVSGSYACE